MSSARSSLMLKNLILERSSQAVSGKELRRTLPLSYQENVICTCPSLCADDLLDDIKLPFRSNSV